LNFYLHTILITEGFPERLGEHMKMMKEDLKWKIIMVDADEEVICTNFTKPVQDTNIVLKLFKEWERFWQET
jgi:hypothetical protein